MRLLALTLLVACSVLLTANQMASAADQPWTPNTAVPGVWQVVSANQRLGSIDVGTNAHERSNQQCEVVRSAWYEPDTGVTATVNTTTCPSPQAAHQLSLQGSAANPQELDGQSIFGSADYVYVPRDAAEHAGYGRVWSQQNLVVAVVTYCARLSPSQCLTTNQLLAASLSQTLPGKPEAAGSTVLYDAVSFALTSLIVPWSLLVGLPGLVSLVRRDRYDIPTRLPTMVDTRRKTRALYLKSLVFSGTVGLRRLLLLLLALTAVSLLFDFQQQTLLGAIVVGVLAILVTPLCKFLNNKLYHAPLYSLSRQAPAGLLVGGIVRLVAYMALTLLALLYASVCWFAAMGGPSSNYNFVHSSALLDRIDAGIGSLRDYILFAAISVSDQPYTVAILLVTATSVILAVNRFGLKLQARTAHEVIQKSTKQPILYLRNFGDDKLKVRASRVSRRGVLGRLSPQRGRPFEETIAWRLNTFASVIAVNDPNVRLRTLGAAKLTLAHDDWKAEVKRLANASYAVLISAAPSVINPGLKWELEMIATRLEHQRVILVIPPWKKKGVIQRWRSFLAVVADYPFYRGLESINPTGAAQVITHVPGTGWKAWGAKHRSEWTYTMSLHEALRDMAAKAGPAVSI